MMTEKPGLKYTGSSTERMLGGLRNAAWIALLPIITGIGIAVCSTMCSAMVDDIREEIALRAEKETNQKTDE